ncbi:thiazole synthase [Simkania negevensis]|uniref:Thiazole synthase n=1 Tax=Simkania negevensis TaxID=83561 RepID=A0ABS3ARN5_9BACT|nr:thiazole synthase [Simkania negevensis]
MVETNRNSEEKFILDGKSFKSRLLLGTARYPDLSTLNQALVASHTEIITVAMRRIDGQSKGIYDAIDRDRYTLLPNTSGCFTAREAVLTAQLAREALETSWIKLEVIGDEDTLYPNVVELLNAAEILISKGFTVFPYCTDDPVICLKLSQMGCAAIMPLAAPIGSGMGVCNPYNLKIIREMIDLPIIIDAGIGTPSDVVQLMEMGMDAVLINTAIAQAADPVKMAKAMYHASFAGRLGFQAGRIPRQRYASSSSPVEGVLR